MQCPRSFPKINRAIVLFAVLLFAGCGSSSATSTTTTSKVVPKPLQSVPTSAWGVYWLGTTNQQSPALRKIQDWARTQSPEVGSGELNCDGIKTLNGKSGDTFAVALYFSTKLDAQKFADNASYPSAPDGVAYATLGCND